MDCWYLPKLQSWLPLRRGRNMEMRSEKGKARQLYTILLVLLKKKIWNEYDHMLICEVFFLGVKYTGIRSINLCTMYLKTFSKCKEKAHRVFAYVAIRSSHSAHLWPCCPLMFLASFLEGRRDKFYWLMTKKEKSFTYHPTVQCLCKELWNHFQNTSPGRNPAFTVCLYKVQRLPATP